MNQPARLLAEEITEDRHLPLAHVGATDDPSETPQSSGCHREVARLLSHGGGLHEPVVAEHERDGSGPPEGGKESVRMMGPINAFAPGDTFAVEARYLVARTGFVAKAEHVLTCWWLRGLRIMLVGEMMHRDYPSWGPPLLHLGAEALLADWNAQPEADKRSSRTCWWLPGLTLMRMGDLHSRHYPSSGAAILRQGIDVFIAAWKARCEEERSREGMGVAHMPEGRLFERSSGAAAPNEPSVTTAPNLMAESPRGETPTPAVGASRAECAPSLAAAGRAESAPVLAAATSCPEWTPSQATDAPSIDEGAPLLAVEAPCMDKNAPALAVEAPYVDGPVRGSQPDAAARPRSSARMARPAERRATSAASLASTRVLAVSVRRRRPAAESYVCGRITKKLDYHIDTPPKNRQPAGPLLAAGAAAIDAAMPARLCSAFVGAIAGPYLRGAPAARPVGPWRARGGRDHDASPRTAALASSRTRQAITSATASQPRGAPSTRRSPTRADGQPAAEQGPTSSRSVAVSSTPTGARSQQWARSVRESSSAHWRSSGRTSRPPRRVATLAKASDRAAKTSPRRDTRWAETGPAAATARWGNEAEPVRRMRGPAVAAIPRGGRCRRAPERCREEVSSIHGPLQRLPPRGRVRAAGAKHNAPARSRATSVASPPVAAQLTAARQPDIEHDYSEGDEPEDGGARPPAGPTRGQAPTGPQRGCACGPSRSAPNRMGGPSRMCPRSESEVALRVGGAGTCWRSESEIRVGGPSRMCSDAPAIRVGCARGQGLAPTRITAGTTALHVDVHVDGQWTGSGPVVDRQWTRSGGVVDAQWLSWTPPSRRREMYLDVPAVRVGGGAPSRMCVVCGPSRRWRRVRVGRAGTCLAIRVGRAHRDRAGRRRLRQLPRVRPQRADSSLLPPCVSRSGCASCSRQWRNGREDVCADARG
jgi:hypothetical protein